MTSDASRDNRPVFTILGSYHPEVDEANTPRPDVLLGGSASVDRSNRPETFAALALGWEGGLYGDFWWPRISPSR